MTSNLAFAPLHEAAEVELEGGPGKRGKAADLGALWSRAAAIIARGDRVRISSETLKRVWRADFSAEEIEAAVAPRRTLARRQSRGELLTVEESDRALRLARLSAEANRVFADREKARRWLRKPNRALNERAPLELATTESGARLVEDLLIRIDHGVFA